MSPIQANRTSCGLMRVKNYPVSHKIALDLVRKSQIYDIGRYRGETFCNVPRMDKSRCAGVDAET